MLERLTPDSEEADYPNGLDAYYGNQCADTQYPHSFASWLAIDKYARAGSRFGPLWWGQHRLRALARECRSVRRSVDGSYVSPVLVVGNFFDGVTDYAGAVASDRLLRNSRMLSYAGWGHTAYGRSQCVTDYVDAYLLTQSLPPNAPRTRTRS